MRLGFHYHIPAQIKDGFICLPGYFGRFIDSLAGQVDRLDLFLHQPSPHETQFMDYPIQADNAYLYDLGPHNSVPRRLLHSGSITAPVRRQRDQLDALLIRGPSPLLPAVARAAGNLPIALLLVGDYLAGVDDLPQPRWRKELIRAFSWWNARQQEQVAARSLTFVNSHKLYRQLQPKVLNLVETRTTTLSEADFFVRADTCQQRPIHLLYTGRMDRAKGLLEMLQALEILLRDGEDVVLDLVGMAEKGDPILDELQDKAASAGLSDRVKYHGYHTIGPDLFRYYQQTDIYILASLASEGFPRTIWEAMAHSLPVVATRVGSIPDFIAGAAELIEPRNVDAIVNAVRLLIRDPERRQEIIVKGRVLARDNTLENRSRDMVCRLEEYLIEKG